MKASDLKKFKKVLICLKPSKIIPGQVGVFSVRALKKRIVVGDIKYLNEDLFFSWEEYKKIDRESKRIIPNFCVATHDGFYAPRDLNYISIPWFINHSCEGNVGFDKIGNFVTIKNVKKDEELCYDYGIAASDPKFQMTCKCGSKKCRGVVGGNDWKDPAFRKKTYTYMTPELKQIIKKAKLCSST